MESLNSQGGGRTLGITDLNPHFVCVLCFGYFVDATTITECMHTFCKSCIVQFLESNHHCPYCDTLLSRTKPLSSLRPDRVMQALVYKTVPTLFQTEMRRRIQFYQKNPHPDFEADVEGVQKYIFNPEDSISLSIQYYTFGETEGLPKILIQSDPDRDTEPVEKHLDLPDVRRYFRCPATVPVSVLKSLIKTKYCIPDFLRVELLYGEECLLDSWTLMEVAYIFQWDRESPMQLTFQVLITKTVKRKRFRLVKRKRKIQKCPESHKSPKETLNGENVGLSEPPSKSSRLETSFLSHTESNSPQGPPTPPQTPDDSREALADFNKKPLSIKIKREVCMSPDRGDPSKISTEYRISHVSVKNEKYTKESEITDPFDRLRFSGNVPNKFSQQESRTQTNPELKSVRSSEEDSVENSGDLDSENGLEVDTSHDTEVEAETANLELPPETNSKFDDVSKSNDTEDDQVDSAIDVTENSASDVMDSDDKDTDFNVSSESIDVETITPLKPLIKEKETNNNLGVLDFSNHARLVRAKRKESDISATSSPSPVLSETYERDNTLPLALGLEMKTPADKFKEFLPAGNPLFSNAAEIPLRPHIPIDWLRPPMIGAPGVHPGTSFRDLVTLSQAAVQLQLAMAHAQAQAQAQVRAQANAVKAKVRPQTQKINARPKVKKSLPNSDTLSFVNNSGDTLTISPVVTANGNAKINPSLKLNKNKSLTTKPDPAKKYNSAAKVKLANMLLSETSAATNNNLNEQIIQNLNNKSKSFYNGDENPLQTPTLKIPQIHSTSKANMNKSDKKETEKRTGDPVFKITNQKLIEFVRKQHQNNKLKHANGKTSDSSSDEACKSKDTANGTVENEANPVNKTIVNAGISQTDESTVRTSAVNGVTQNRVANSPHIKTLDAKCTINSFQKSFGSKSISITPLQLPSSCSNLYNSLSFPQSKSSTLDSSGKSLQLNRSSSSFITKSNNISSTSSPSAIRTTNTHVRQIPNPSRLHQQSENRLSVGMHSIGGILKNVTAKNEGISRIESLTRTLHEKVAASAAVSSKMGVVNSFAR